MTKIASPFGLSGHHALITGGGSGLGLAATRCMREAGAAVTIVGTDAAKLARARAELRSEEHTSELQSLMRISYAVFCLKKKKKPNQRMCPYDQESQN